LDSVVISLSPAVYGSDNKSSSLFDLVHFRKFSLNILDYSFFLVLVLKFNRMDENDHIYNFFELILAYLEHEVLLIFEEGQVDVHALHFSTILNPVTICLIALQIGELSLLHPLILPIFLFILVKLDIHRSAENRVIEESKVVAKTVNILLLLAFFNSILHLCR